MTGFVFYMANNNKTFKMSQYIDFASILYRFGHIHRVSVNFYWLFAGFNSIKSFFFFFWNEKGVDPMNMDCQTRPY